MIQAAERVLDRHGVEALTTNRVAEVAGVSIGSLYQYFPNKQAIIGALLDRYMEAFSTAVGSTLATFGDAPLGEILGALAHALAATYRQQRPVHRHLRELGAALGLAERREQSLTQMLAMVEAYLRAHPELTVHDPAKAAFVIVHAVDGVLNAFADRALVDMGEADELVLMLTRYLGTH